MRLAIIGNGIIANLGALYWRARLPDDVEITIIGPDSRGGMPVVGESTIEITAQFLENKLGLTDYLRETHYPKYALTYYFKLDPTNPDDRRYSVQCNERDPVDLRPIPEWEGPMARPPSWQLNRSVFDRDMRERVTKSAGIERVLGMISSVDLAEKDGSDSLHHLTIKDAAGTKSTYDADWVIDATGRRQFLAKRLGLTQKAKAAQRDCFWFRLADFRPELLEEIDALGPKPPREGESYHYDRYFSTHHFMGKGNWIWLIPMRTADGSSLISIGISSRPDVYPHKVRNVEDFLEHVASEHPVITDLVRSGRILDTNTLSNYRYVISQAYSKDRWAIVGDAAFAPDPLFSNGLAFSTVQLEQVGEMIARDHAGKHSADYIAEMEKVFWGPVVGSQNTIADWYETMDDPLSCAARLHFIEVSYFYWLLPLVVNRCHVEPERLNEFAPLLLSGGKPVKLPKKLTDLREKIRIPDPDCFVYHGKSKVNLKALEVYEDVKELRAQMTAGAALLNAYVGELEAAWQRKIDAQDSEEVSS